MSKHKSPSLAARRKVMQLVGSGTPLRDVAKVMGLTAAQLRRQFSTEIAQGPAKCRAEVLTLLWKSARAGKIPAIRKLEEMTRPAGGAAGEGKKAEAAREANEVIENQGEWGSDLTPATSRRLQ